MKTDKIIEKCKSALKKTSRDNKNDNMTESNLEVIDFDCLKDKYLGKIQFKGVGIRSNDALFTRKKKYIFIEFKNGNLDGYCEELKHEKIRSKINESLWILNDIMDETLSFDRQSINYILVYNKVKNSNYSIKNTLAKKAGKAFLIAGFDRYNVFFHDVKTMDEEDFKTITNDLENSRYIF